MDHGAVLALLWRQGNIPEADGLVLGVGVQEPVEGRAGSTPAALGATVAAGGVRPLVGAGDYASADCCVVSRV